MLLRRVNKRHVILNDIFRSGEIERLHSLKFDSLRLEEKWRIAAWGKGPGGFPFWRAAMRKSQRNTDGPGNSTKEDHYLFSGAIQCRSRIATSVARRYAEP